MARKITNEIIAAAIAGFEAQKKKIDEQIAELRQTLKGGPVESAATPEPAKRKRKLSAAGRRAIAEAARKRWAAIKAAKVAETPKPAAAKKPAAKKAAVKKAVKKAAKKAVKKAAVTKPAAPAETA